MLTAGNPLARPEQALEIKADADVEQAVIDLVGDLAAYKPGAKLVFLEGSGESPFDQHLLFELFPEFTATVNLISSGSKARVRKISDLLDRARSAGAVVGKAFAITDRDSDDFEDMDSKNAFAWDRYHIENYLLEPDFIAKPLIDLNLARTIDVRPEGLMKLLRDCAGETLSQMVRHELEDPTSKLMVRAISANTPRDSDFNTADLRKALERSKDRIDELLKDSLSDAALSAREQDLRTRFESDLNSGRWVATFRGRDILKRFVSKHMNGVVRYEVFRDLIVARMRDAKFRPEGIEQVLKKIEKA